MIEDSPTTINELVKVVKVLYYDTRYNRSIEHENITRVYSWYDIYMKINEMKELLSKYDLNYDEVCQGKSEIEWKVELFIGVMKIIKFNKR